MSVLLTVNIVSHNPAQSSSGNIPPLTSRQLVACAHVLHLQSSDNIQLVTWTGCLVHGIIQVNVARDHSQWLTLFVTCSLMMCFWA